MTAVVQFSDALLSNLAHTLTGKSHLCADFLQTTLLTTNAKALTDDFQLTIL